MSMFKDSYRTKSGYDLLQRTATDSLMPDTTQGKGPFLAKVLRVKQVVGGQGHLTWVDELENNFAIENPDEPNPFTSLSRLIINARITSKYLAGQPNYHAHIPEPEKLGNPAEVDVKDDVYIDLHDEFISLNETSAAQVPKVGDFVWVDYLDKKNRTRPTYIGPLKGVMGVASSPPCGVQTTPSAPFNKTPPTGNNVGKVPNNPAGLRNKKVSLPPKDNKYTLHGYVLENFTKQVKKFSQTPILKAQVDKLLAGVEVFHWYVQQLYPGTKVQVYDPKAATTWGHAAKSSHKFGSGLDFKVKVNGKKISNTKAWAIIIKLIMTGKIPDGGVGFYQTATGPNKGVSTTYGTSRPPSGCPHWDPAYPQPGEPLFVNPILKDKKGNPVLDKKGQPKRKKLLPKADGYAVRKWYWGARNGKTVKRYGKSAEKLLKRPMVPRYAIQEYASLPNPDPKMPTWEQVIAMRNQIAGSTAPVVNPTVPPPPPPKPASPPEKAATPTPPADPKAGDKPEAKPDAKPGDKPATKPPDTAASKKQEAATQSQPAAKVGQKPAAPAAITPCVPGSSGTPNITPGKTPAPGQTAGPPKTGQVNSGTQIKFPAKGKPKALYSNENVTTDVYTKKSHVLKHVTMFVIHETAGHGTSYSNAASRAKKIKMGKTYTSTNKKTGETKEKPYTNWKQVHFWGGRAGDTALTTPLNRPCAHANWCNWISVGIEVINMSNVPVKPGRIGDRITEGYKYLHPLGNVGGTAQSSGKGNGVLKHATSLFGKNRLYMLPSERQCRMTWDLIRWLSGPNRPHKDVFKIPILFPATANSKKLSTGFKSSVGGGAPVFIWGRFNPMVAGFKTKPPKTSWKSYWREGLGSGARFKPKHHWQKGIVCHQRWHHSDGAFIEFYCLARAKGMSSKQAFFATIGGLAATNPKNNKKLNAGRSNFTYFPDKNFINYGKKIWGSNGSLNWAQKHASLVTGKKKYGKRDVANNKTKWTKVLA